ncbi:44959_t:CDS:1, partial [Gigaspora margarita]
PDDHAKIFIYKLHKVVKNVKLEIETSESLTDLLVDDLLFLAINFNDWSLMVD